MGGQTGSGRHPFRAAVHADRADHPGDRLNHLYEPVDGQVATERAKEVGVRKVMGAGKGKLVRQFIGESLVLSFVAMMLAVGIVYLALPAFNQLVGKALTI